MKYNGIFLDDERWPKDVTWITLPDANWLVVRTTLDVQDAIKNVFDGQLPEYVSFDHDLQEFYEYDVERTGYDCLKWVVKYAMEYDMMLPTCSFHTQNIVGERNMRSYYQGALKHI